MKLCFVTTGATAPFTSLITSILTPSTLDALLAQNYTHLLIQYGSAADIYTAHLAAATTYLREQGKETALEIQGMDFNANGLRDEFKAVQESGGCVVSHAGSGTILAALRYAFPLIVVPNAQLLDNHQEELAGALEKSNYLVRGDVRNLAPALQTAESFRANMKAFPPVTSGKHRETKSFAAIMDETLGFMD